MRKSIRRDFRRETSEIIKKLNLTDEEIAVKLRTSVRTAQRWRKEISSPQPNQFERLKELDSSTLLPNSHISKHTPGAVQTISMDDAGRAQGGEDMEQVYALTLRVGQFEGEVKTLLRETLAKLDKLQTEIEELKRGK